MKHFLRLLAVCALALAVYLLIRDRGVRTIPYRPVSSWSLDNSGYLYVDSSSGLYAMPADRAGSIFGSGAMSINGVSGSLIYGSRNHPYMVGTNSGTAYLLDPTSTNGYREIARDLHGAGYSDFFVSSDDRNLLCVAIEGLSGSGLLPAGAARVMVFDGEGGKELDVVVEEMGGYGAGYAYDDGEGKLFCASPAVYSDGKVPHLTMVDGSSGEQIRYSGFSHSDDFHIRLSGGMLLVSVTGSRVMAFDYDLQVLLEYQCRTKWFPPVAAGGNLVYIDEADNLVGVDMQGRELMHESLGGRIDDYFISGDQLYIRARDSEDRCQLKKVNENGSSLETVAELPIEGWEKVYGGMISGNRYFASDNGGKLRSFPLD